MIHLSEDINYLRKRVAALRQQAAEPAITEEKRVQILRLARDMESLADEIEDDLENA